MAFEITTHADDIVRWWANHDTIPGGYITIREATECEVALIQKLFHRDLVDNAPYGGTIKTLFASPELETEKAPPRFFAPDEETPGLKGEPWQIGDVFCFGHGPNPNNTVAVRVTKLTATGEYEKDEFIWNAREVFATELAPYYARRAQALAIAESDKKFCYVGAPKIFALELECRILNEAFDGQCYLVGSVLQRADWRDVDVRMMMDDAAFATLFPDVGPHDGHWEFDPRWLLLTTAISERLSRVTKLPIDFQFQPQTFANKHHRGMRNAMGIHLKSDKTST